MQILFIHGRAQEEFTQEILLETWAKALKSSFENAQIAYPDNLVLTLPYYGKDLIIQRDLYKKDVKNGKFKMRSPTQNDEDALDECYGEILEDLRINANISRRDVAEEAKESQQYRGITNNRSVIALARLLDEKLDNVGNFIVKWKTEDVATYLIVDSAREEINDINISLLTKEPTIIIAHSLGTVIAYNLLHSLTGKNYDIRGLITLGSPLGVNSVKRQLHPRQLHPTILKGPWINIYDPKDIVSLNPLNDKNFRITPKIENHEVENESANRHDITPYLSSPLVAQTINNILQSENE